MTSVDTLWFLADEADQRAAQTYHRLLDEYDDVREFETTKHVSRQRFRTIAERVSDNGAPYGAHTLTYRPGGELLLVRHAGVDQWVLPGGEINGDEQFREGAARELWEEAGIEADYKGLELLGRVTFFGGSHTTWGVLPVFAAVGDGDPEVRDPDDEITRAAWFDELPPDTRDRELLASWLDERFG